MNVFHLSCRNVRPLLSLFIAVILVYIITNVVYITFIDSDSQETDVVVKTDDAVETQSIAANVKFGKPDANGKIEVVLSLNMKQLASLLDSSDLQNLLPEEVEGRPETPLKLTGSPPGNVSFILHDPSLCDSLDQTGLHWIFVVNSDPENKQARSLLRETWANAELFRNKMFTTVFLIGLTSDHNIQKSIQDEFDTHHDIVQGNFMDTARNSTLKGLMALRYVTQFCSNASYLIKTNDDTFLNVFEIIKLMQSAKSRRYSIVCPLWQDYTMPILRDPKNCMEWCVSENELPGRTHFPQYCAGVAFALSRDLIPALYEESRSTPYFWIDDVYITGLLTIKVAATRGSINYINIMQNLTLVEKDVESHYANKNKPVTVIVGKVPNASVFRRIWKDLLNRLTPSQFKLLSDSAIAGL